MLDRNSLLFSPTRDAIPSSDDNFSAQDIISATEALEQESRDTLPFDPTVCSYNLGPLRQPIYACKTCPLTTSGGFCSGCSVSCGHSSHELVELFHRRDFRCDCGTGLGCCSIDKRQGAPKNEENTYDSCFRGIFCVCCRPYDPATEEEEMFACAVCENWLHYGCLFEPGTTPPIGEDDFDVLVCSSCIKSDRNGVKKLMNGWAGVAGRGVLLVGENVEGMLEDDATEEIDLVGDLEEELETSTKRPLDDDTSAVEHKKPRLDPESSTIVPIASNSRLANCSAPSVDKISPLDKIIAAGKPANVFLQEDIMERWCRCSACIPLFDKLPFLLDEEETYEPPSDTTPHQSIMDMGMTALFNMPRVAGIEATIAFQQLSVRLKAFLAPKAAANEAVTSEDIQGFFAAEREAAA